MNTLEIDELPHTSNVMPYTHPEHLAAVAHGHQQSSPPVATARVLELACGDGANLLAIAAKHPHSECWGIDLSSSRISSGQMTAKKAGLNNIILKTQDILQFPAQWGLFDYIIVHGIYSWVDTAIQDKILMICQQHLRPQGLAYLSYDTYPGWHRRQMLYRQLICLLQQSYSQPSLDVLLKALEKLLTQSVFDAQNQKEEFVKIYQSLKTMPQAEDYLQYLANSPHRPLYFFEWLQKIADFNLGYLAESLPLKHASPPAELALSPLAYQQWLDIYHNTHFRRSILTFKK